jgi:hypothetical protein
MAILTKFINRCLLKQIPLLVNKCSYGDTIYYILELEMSLLCLVMASDKFTIDRHSLESRDVGHSTRQVKTLLRHS